MTRREMWIVALCSAVFCVACEQEEEASEPEPKQQQMPLCVAHTLEDDAMLDSNLGEMGDVSKWGPLPPNAIVAGTYLKLKPGEDVMEVFGQINGPIIAELSKPAKGLMGLSVMFSPSCGTARTLTVWASEQEMLDFVMGEAHAKAIQRVGEVSRGGSITHTWPVSNFEKLSWANVVAGFKDHDGPTY